MGYSHSTRAVQRVKNHLDEMLRSDKKLEWADPDPTRLAYRINDGIAAARHNAFDRDKRPIEPYVTYARLKAKFIIKIEGTKVVAEPRDVMPLEIVRAGMGKMVVNEVQDVLEVVGAAIMHKAPEMFFPDADALDEREDLPQLYAWASKNGYYIIPSEDGVTLTQNDPGEIAWTPEEQ
jgi:hypothetical protein